ncbi:hypothetical protein ACOSP7_004348 [Xanthoceras sorbifolium]
MKQQVDLNLPHVKFEEESGYAGSFDSLGILNDVLETSKVDLVIDLNVQKPVKGRAHQLKKSWIILFLKRDNPNMVWVIQSHLNSHTRRSTTLLCAVRMNGCPEDPNIPNNMDKQWPKQSRPDSLIEVGHESLSSRNLSQCKSCDSTNIMPGNSEVSNGCHVTTESNGFKCNNSASKLAIDKSIFQYGEEGKYTPNLASESKEFVQSLFGVIQQQVDLNLPRVRLEEESGYGGSFNSLSGANDALETSKVDLVTDLNVETPVKTMSTLTKEILDNIISEKGQTKDGVGYAKSSQQSSKEEVDSHAMNYAAASIYHIEEESGYTGSFDSLGGANDALDTNKVDLVTDLNVEKPVKRKSMLTKEIFNNIVSEKGQTKDGVVMQSHLSSHLMMR